MICLLYSKPTYVWRVDLRCHNFNSAITTPYNLDKLIVSDLYFISRILAVGLTFMNRASQMSTFLTVYL
jgi:hypothetical protein